MIIPICIGHNSQWCSRIGIGEHASSSLQSAHDSTFYASDSPLPGMIPICIGSAGDRHTDHWRSSVSQGHNAAGNGWAHCFVFYAFPQKQPGTVPYAVGHADYEAGGWKFRLEANIEFAGDKGWTHDFVFYVYPVNPNTVIPVAVGYNDTHWTNKCKFGVKCKDEFFKHGFTFKALNQPTTETIPISIGSAGHGGTYRHSIGQKENASGNGWNHEFVFYVFPTQKPGTIPYAVGHAEWSHGWKFRLSDNCTNAGDKGWTHDFVFYAYPADTSLMVPISVGHEEQNWVTRCKEGDRLEEAYFKHVDTFHAFRSQYPGTIPIALGESGNTYNHTLRSRVDNGPHAGGNGWNHVMTFYAFPEQKPGTVPVSVGHADYEQGGWKYRVSVNEPSAGGNGWTHDFTFYAYH